MDINSKIISYFKDCYQSDNRETSIINFYGSKVENQLLLNSPELIQGKLLQYPINTVWAEEVSKKIKLYSQEKDLLCCSLFVVGKLQKGQKLQKVVAPLFFQRAEIFYEKEIFYLELSEGENSINPAIFSFLETRDQNFPDLFAFLNEELPRGPIDFDAQHQVEEVFQNTFSNIDIRLFEKYPELSSKKEMEALLNDLEPKQFLLIPMAGVGMVRKSYLSRGVINELDEISKAPKLSKPLEYLFSDELSETGTFKKSIHYVPANLSEAQQNILDSIDSFDTSYVVGPPGTGKSYTIAAIAIDAISKGKSILISSKNDQAVDVIAKKIEDDFGVKGVLIRGGRKDYARALKNKLENIVSGIGVKQPDWKTLNKLKVKIDKLLLRILTLEKRLIQREEDEMIWGDFLLNDPQGFLNNIRRRIHLWKHERRKPYWEEIDLLESLINEKEHLIKEYVQKKYDLDLYTTLEKNRKTFQFLLKGLRARTGNKRAFMYRGVNYQHLFKALPIWLVKASEINDVLPLTRELFDLVVIDEATQCDIASSIPVLFRGAKTVIVGDPKQLRHVSFLSHARQKKMLNDYGLNEISYDLLNFREQSILDLVSNSLSNQNQIHFLNEHYRSKPDIINFSNRTFYDQSLRIMTQPIENEEMHNVVLHQVNGKRLKSGYNKKEVEHLTEMVQEIIEKEKDLDNKLCQSIGILSPFRDQVDYIRKQIDKVFTLGDMERHKILIGTPYAFQGDERDIMFLSFAADNETHSSTFHYLNKADVLNVSITRARVKQHILTSFSDSKLVKDKIFSKFIASIGVQNKLDKSFQNPGVDYFSESLKKELQKLGVETFFENYSLAGFEIDLLFIYNQKAYGIDLVGYPGVYNNAFPIGRYKMLFRIGIKVMTIPFSSWKLNKDQVVKKLKESIL